MELANGELRACSPPPSSGLNDSTRHLDGSIRWGRVDRWALGGVHLLLPAEEEYWTSSDISARHRILNRHGEKASRTRGTTSFMHIMAASQLLDSAIIYTPRVSRASRDIAGSRPRGFRCNASWRMQVAPLTTCHNDTPRLPNYGL